MALLFWFLVLLFLYNSIFLLHFESFIYSSDSLYLLIKILIVSLIKFNNYFFD